MSRKQRDLNEKIDAFFKPDENGFSEWKDRESFSRDVKNLGNNGFSRNGIMCGDNRYKWEFKRAGKGPSTKILKIRTVGFNTEGRDNTNRPIRKDIDTYYKSQPCICCGRTNDLVCDHKNDLYNDPRVLDTKTQTFDDFQCLCRGCNLRKREVSNKTKAEGKRISAQMMPFIKTMFPGLHFTKGDFTFIKEDPAGMVGTYWYDPADFINKAIIIRDAIKTTGQEMNEETVTNYFNSALNQSSP